MNKKTVGPQTPAAAGTMKTGDKIRYVCRSGLQAPDVRFPLGHFNGWLTIDILGQVGTVVRVDTTRKILVQFPNVPRPVAMFMHPDDFEEAGE
jgi:hypothetical protein